MSATPNINPLKIKGNNLAATDAPDANDDINDGYNVGSVWINVTLNKGYICTQSTAGIAIWKEIGAAGSGTNIANADLTFDANHYANLNAKTWELKDGSNSVIKFTPKGNGGAIATNGSSVVNSSFNVKWDGTSNNMFSVSNGNTIIHTLSYEDYTMKRIDGSTDFFSVNRISANATINLHNTAGTKIFRIDSSAVNSFLHSNFLLKASNNSSSTSGFKITDINDVSLLDVKNNGQTTLGNAINNPLVLNYNGTGTYGIGLDFNARNSANAETNFARIIQVATDVTAGSEDGGLWLRTMIGGTLTTSVILDNKELLVDASSFTDNAFRVKDGGLDCLKVTTNKQTYIESGSFNPLVLNVKTAGTNGVGFDFNAYNSSSAEHNFARIVQVATDITAGSEDGQLLLRVSDSGTITTKVAIKTDSTTFSEKGIFNKGIDSISTSTVPSFTAKSDGTTDGYIQLNCTANTHGIKLKSPPHSATASYTLTFPNDTGTSGQVLKTDGNGLLSWGASTSNDTNAIHDNESGEISAITLKANVVNADMLLIEDSAASNAKKRTTISDIKTAVASAGTPGIAQSIHSFEIASTTSSTAIANTVYTVKVIPTVLREVTKMSLFVTNYNVGHVATLGIYNNSGTLLTQGSVSITGLGINTSTLGTAVTLAANTEYYFAIWDDGGVINYASKVLFNINILGRAQSGLASSTLPNSIPGSATDKCFWINAF
jgi:hypothetical protein